jgi:tetratricopeptide (TPR) repeat protein
MKAIDPNATPRASGRGNDLIFLDLEERRSRSNSIIAKRATQGLDIIHTGEFQEIDAPVPEPEVADTPAPTPELLDTPAIEPALLDAVTRSAEFEHPGEAAGPLDGLDIGAFQGEPLDPPAEPSTTLLGFEPTDFAGSFAAPARATPLGTPAQDAPEPELLDFTLPESDGPAAPLNDLPMIDDEPAHGATPRASSSAIDDDTDTIGGDLPLIAPDDESEQTAADPLADIPLMDFSLPTPGEAMTGISGSPASEGSAIDFLELDEDSLAEASGQGTTTSGAGDDFPISADEPLAGIPTPPAARPSSTIEAGHSVEVLRASVESTPDDHTQRRQLAEAMLESGDREGGLRELELAMVGFERADALEEAASVADEIVRLDPESIRHHQKRVEYAFRTNERGRLIEAYLALADTLFRAGQLEKSRAIYHRVIELAPDDIRAQSALENFAEVEPEPEPPRHPQRVTGAAPRVPAAPRTSRPTPVPDDEFVNLGDWLRDDEAPKDTRMVVEEKEPTGDEEADFQDMLRKFKQGISDNVEEEDHQSHYDLGVAYKEMGLLDEAIAEFQKALRAPSNRVPTYEALGLCFMEKDQVPMAATILGRALHEKGVSEDQLVGVLYLLGRCAELRGQRDQAVDYYQRVFVIDIQFKDVGERLAAVEGARS